MEGKVNAGQGEYRERGQRARLIEGKVNRG